jgi:hypothetical protein
MNDMELLADAAARAIRYLDTLPARPVAPTPEAIAALSAFEEPFPANAAIRRRRCGSLMKSDRPRRWRWRARVSLVL